MIIICDIDETICSKANNADYSKVNPLKNNIKKINKLYEQGHTIIYWTSRGSTTNINWFNITYKQLKKWKCKFHELKMGKPHYDIFICDKSKRIEEL